MQSLITTNKNFTYVSDPNNGEKDKWTVRDNRKPFQGDCEDYALAVAYEISGYSKVKSSIFSRANSSSSIVVQGIAGM